MYLVRKPMVLRHMGGGQFPEMQGQTKLPLVRVLASYFEIACHLGGPYSPCEGLFKCSLCI
jgi:hypothetical protein